jgi:site-specific DNA-methyltransferase (cytosine-N4-specific)
MSLKHPDGSRSVTHDATVYLDDEYPGVEQAAKKLGYADAREYLLARHDLNRSGALHVPHKSPPQPGPDSTYPRPALERPRGTLYHGDSATLMLEELKPESVDLIMTSPPFGLVRKKSYGNGDADDYVDWFEQFAQGFQRVLKESGSLVIDIGGAWKRGHLQSVLA